MASCALLIATLCLSCGLSLGGVLPYSDQQEAVHVHNKYRMEAGAVAMQRLKWNDDLANFAANTAAQCTFDHTSFQSRQNIGGFEYIGESIYTITGVVDQPTITTAVDDWASEMKDYDLNSNWCSSMCGHHTQIVWANTTDVGCAVAKCDSVRSFNGDAGYLIFCNYGIGGNIVGQKPFDKAYSSSEVGSKCQEYFKNYPDGNGLCA